MTSLLAVRAGRTGQVYAFEPHPDVHPQLMANFQAWSSVPNLAPIRVQNLALSNQSGSTTLFEAPNTSVNCDARQPDGSFHGLRRVGPGGFATGLAGG